VSAGQSESDPSWLGEKGNCGVSGRSNGGERDWEEKTIKQRGRGPKIAFSYVGNGLKGNKLGGRKTEKEMTELADCKETSLR